MQTATEAHEKGAWTVEGMDCSGCKTKIERVLQRTPGVLSGEVNFMSKRMTVEFDPAVIASERVEGLIGGLGFELSRIVDQAGEGPSREASPSPGSVHKVSALYWNAKAREVVVAVVALAGAWAIAAVIPKGSVFAWIIGAVVAGLPVFRRAISSTRAGVPFSIEMLMSVAVVGAVVIGAMEEAALVIILFLIGEWLESVATAKARDGISELISLAPATAWRLEGDGAKEVPTQALAPGDRIQVRPGDRVPTDGTIEEGESLVDESLLTGESVPVARRVGDPLTAGTLNGDGRLVARVEASTKDNTLARIGRLIEAAESEKSPTARFIERFSRWYTPAVFASAVLVAVVPPLLWAEGDFKTWVYRGLGLLLIGCPCALVLSVPAAVTSAIARGTRMGILAKGGAALEAIGGVRVVAFDKTGTLTKGTPELVAAFPSDEVSRSALLRLAASVEQGASHPLAAAIVRAARSESLPLSPIKNARALPGMGVEADVGPNRYALLSPRALREAVDLSPREDEVRQEEEKGRTVVGLVLRTEGDSRLLGLLSLADTLREDAAASVSELKQLGVRPVLLTGDNARAAHTVATSLGIEVLSELRPEAKLQALRDLKAKGRVAMVGDGINDAPALAAADVGIAMGSGTGVAIETADAVLHHDKVRGVVDLLRLSRRTRQVILQNVTVALGLKAVFLVTTVLGITGLWIAVLSDTGATVLVTLNSLRLLSFNRLR